MVTESSSTKERNCVSREVTDVKDVKDAAISLMGIFEEQAKTFETSTM